MPATIRLISQRTDQVHMLQSVILSWLTRPKTHIYGVLGLLLYVLIANAWVLDDAYITFRSVDHFVSGRGLIWNPGERVQVFTHPLWMLLMSFCYSITHEFFFTVIALSMLVTLAAVFIASATLTQQFQTALWKIPLLIMGVCASKAFIDYASSGLETCLSYLLAALFIAKWLSLPQTDVKQTVPSVAWLFFLAALAFVNRLDTILLYAPALLYLLWTLRGVFTGRVLLTVLLAFSPALLWELFSLIYYGFPFPNTAYAKNLATGLTAEWKFQRGLAYLANSVYWDTSSYVLLVGGLVLTLKAKAPQNWAIMAGVLLYIAYVVVSAASATHMSGRFFAVPIFMAIFLLVHLLTNQRAGRFIAVFLWMGILLNPLSALKFGTSFYHPDTQNFSYIDTKWFTAADGAALINWRPHKSMPDHIWYKEGERIGKLSQPVHVGGPCGGVAIGYFGVAAGPELFIIDRAALSDPLLARLPAVQPKDMPEIISGHFLRNIPAGYVASVAQNRNLLEDAHLRHYYAAIRVLTRDPLFSWARFRTIWTMNTGGHELHIKQLAKQAVPDHSMLPIDKQSLCPPVLSQ